MNTLRDIFEQHDGHLLDKWIPYLEVYERHFACFRGKALCLVEFGVSQGGSIQLWQRYFGENVVYFGIDINPDCKQFEAPGVHIIIGDQGDREFLRSLARLLPAVDILIDDGGHTMTQQRNTFEVLFPLVKPNGIYLVEDLHTSYWKKWGGGYKKRGSFVEYSKDFIDKINAWHSHDPKKLSPDSFTKSTHSLHYYDSILVIEKRPMVMPTRIRKGESLFADYKHQSPRFIDRIRRRLGKR